MTENYNIFKKIILIALGLFIFYTIVGVFSRDIFLNESTPFPSWTYDTKNPLSVWTSWDSGFYYDLAKNGYPDLSKKIPVAYVEIPPTSWIKVFMGGGTIGEAKFELPVSSFTDRINNVVIATGSTTSRVSIPIYDAYEGITYCTFKGDINFERDVRVVNNSLTSATACGTQPCDQSFVTYYSYTDRDVVYQEVFNSDNFDIPQVLYGETRPAGFSTTEYRGEGCTTIIATDVVQKSPISYEKQFTTFAFMPLYSGLVKNVGNLLNNYLIAGLLVSFISFVISALALYKLIFVFYKDSELAWKATLIYMLFPLSFFNLAFLPMSLFAMFFFSTLYFAKDNKNLLMLTSMSLVFFTHIYGIFILIPLFFVLRERIKLLVLAVVVMFANLAIFSSIMHGLTQDWLLLLNARSPWYGDATTFVGGLVIYATTFNIYMFFELIILALLIILSYLGYKKHNEDPFLYGLVTTFVAFMLFNGSFSGLSKLYVVLVPMFLYLAGRDNKKSKIALAIFLFIGAALFSLWTISSRLLI